MENLKPCPFCGGQPALRKETQTDLLYDVICINCSCGTALWSEKEIAIEK